MFSRVAKGIVNKNARKRGLSRKIPSPEYFPKIAELIKFGLGVPSAKSDLGKRILLRNKNINCWRLGAIFMARRRFLEAFSHLFQETRPPNGLMKKQ